MLKQVLAIVGLLAATEAWASLVANVPAQISHRTFHEQLALSDLLKLSPRWNQSNFINFCKHPFAPKSLTDCENGMKFNASSCTCYGNKQERTKSGTATAARNSLTYHHISESSNAGSNIDWEDFIADAAQNGLYQASCDVQLGLIYVPQPSDLSYVRFPIALYGPVCMGYSFLGFECVPSDEVTISQEVDKLYFMADGMYHVLGSEYVRLPLAKSCAEKCTVTPSACVHNQVFDKNICTCLCPEQRHCDGNTVWNDATCRCECLHLPSACGAGTRFDSKLCMCTSIYSTASAPSLYAKPAKPVATTPWPFSIRQSDVDEAEDCTSFLICFDQTTSPAYDSSSGMCTCPRSKADKGDTEKEQPECRNIQCDSRGLVKPVPDNDRRGCICPCSKAHNEFTLFHATCPNYLCQIVRS